MAAWYLSPLRGSNGDGATSQGFTPLPMFCQAFGLHKGAEMGLEGGGGGCLSHNLLIGIEQKTEGKGAEVVEVGIYNARHGVARIEPMRGMVGGSMSGRAFA